MSSNNQDEDKAQKHQELEGRATHFRFLIDAFTHVRCHGCKCQQANHYDICGNDVTSTSIFKFVVAFFSLGLVYLLHSMLQTR